MRRWLRRIAAGVLVLAALAAVAVWWTLRGSVPQLDGDVALPGLAAPVSVQRDALGVVTIEAANERDALRALGYVHAQERFFEMDLMRRTAAGELAALFGSAAVEVDRKRRVHRLRARTRANFEAIVGARKADLQAYTEGVNAGLASLRTRPWPYLLLRQHPTPWRPEDTPLVGFAMYLDLQEAQTTRDLARWKLQPHLPPALFALLTHGGSRWDAPLAGAVIGDAQLPGPAEVDLRRLPARTEDGVRPLPTPIEVGSNSFAVSGAATRDGRAILANDMHLGLRAPNVWFRAQLRYPDARAPGGRVDIGGVTLPGMPAVIVGSNGHVAWGFTNSYIDSADWARLPTRTRSRTHRETIQVAGGAPVAFEVHESPWGPILDRDAQGHPLALRWAAHLPGALRLDFMDMAYARDLDDALARADRVGIPSQNLLVADRRDIAWRILGPIPMRAPGCETGVVDASSCAPFVLRTDRSPVVARPVSGRLWTANARVADGLGDGGYALGVRAKQIRDGLFARPNFDERALLAIQLDDRALLVERWSTLLQEMARAKPGDSALRALADQARDWNGRASADSVGFRIVRNWRRAVHDRLSDGLTAPAQAALGKDFTMPALPQFEGVAWPLVTQRPAHLLPRRFASWDALFEDAARAVRADLEEHGPLAERTWGEQNTARICHPLIRAVPFAKPWLCMPADPLPGDGSTPRVQTPDNGASQRMVVAPGHEADGILHMPGGQSGHPLSPFWGAGHDDWVHGRPTPFLPGESTHLLKLH